MVIRVSAMVISHKCIGGIASYPLSSELFNLSLGICKAAMLGVGEGEVRDGIAMLLLIGGLILLSHH